MKMTRNHLMMRNFSVRKKLTSCLMPVFIPYYDFQPQCILVKCTSAIFLVMVNYFYSCSALVYSGNQTPEFMTTIMRHHLLYIILLDLSTKILSTCIIRISRKKHPKKPSASKLQFLLISYFVYNGIFMKKSSHINYAPCYIVF